MRIFNMFSGFENKISTFLIGADALNLINLINIELTSFILPHAKCFGIFMNFPKLSCFGLNSCSKTPSELQIAFLKPPGNPCTLLRRL
jgi:hypothetical protein